MASRKSRAAVVCLSRKSEQLERAGSTPTRWRGRRGQIAIADSLKACAEERRPALRDVLGSRGPRDDAGHRPRSFLLTRSVSPDSFAEHSGRSRPGLRADAAGAPDPRLRNSAGGGPGCQTTGETLSTAGWVEQTEWRCVRETIS